MDQALQKALELIEVQDQLIKALEKKVELLERKLWLIEATNKLPWNQRGEKQLNDHAQ